MISLLLILPLLVQLCLSHLLIILIMGIMNIKLKQLVTTQIKANLFQEHPLRLKKKKTRNPRTKKENNKKSQQKKPHFYHHCGVSGHTRPNSYKWLATQQSNSVLSSGGQGQISPSLGPFGDLFKAFMFFLNLNGFNSSPSTQDQRFAQRKAPSKVWKEKGSK